jgi:hypothetical protein
VIDFVELYRYQQAPTVESVTLNEGTPEETTEEHPTYDTDGNPVFHEVDLFEGCIDAVMALRMETTRTNSSTAKLASAEAELAELRAMIAKLQGTPAGE